jgi:hypothetical protein
MAKHFFKVMGMQGDMTIFAIAVFDIAVFAMSLFVMAAMTSDFIVAIAFAIENLQLVQRSDSLQNG